MKRRRQRAILTLSSEEGVAGFKLRVAYKPSPVNHTDPASLPPSVNAAVRAVMFIDKHKREIGRPLTESPSNIIITDQ